MFTRGITILLSSALDTGNIPAPRPSDLWAERCAQAAMRAMQADAQFMPLSQRLKDPDRYRAIQRARRDQLEAFLWAEPNAAAIERMLDLISLICEEGSWGASGLAFDDPAHPEIDVQAAETGVLLAWLLRRHGKKLQEAQPRLHSVILHEMRRRLFAPLLAHDDYPFMNGLGVCPALILADLLLSCLLLEKNPARRQQPLKVLLRLLDKNCTLPPDGNAPLAERIADACAIADLARLLKRLTRGEMDLTRNHPPESWLDGAIIPWITGEYFFDPAAGSLCPAIPGIDIFRLGYLSRDRALCTLGAQLHRANERPASSVSGRVLSMEYLRAAQDEISAPPRMKRAAMENGAMMVSRVDSLFAAIAGMGNFGNAGDVVVFAGNAPILAAEGEGPYSLPMIHDYAPLDRPERPAMTDVDFSEDRDLMSVDLTDAYPLECPLNAYQRTMMTLRGDGSVRLVDAFEFARPVDSVCFRFVAALRPLPLRDSVCIGPVRMSWDGNMQPEIAELPPSPAAPAGRWLLTFRLEKPQKRLICGFSFEMN